MRDEKRTLDCLKKGARIASQCLDINVQVQLYVELLNSYLYYYERGNTQITVSMLNQVTVDNNIFFEWFLRIIFTILVNCKNQ